MPYMMGRITVDDYAKFREVFDGRKEMRKSAGALGSKVFQSVDNPNEVIIAIEFPTAEAAKAFQGSQALREAQERAGSKEPPRTLVVQPKDSA